MSLILVSKIVITQLPTTAYPNRNEIYTIESVNSCEIESSWMNLTDKAHLVFPKNLYVKTANDKQAWLQQSMYITEPPPVNSSGGTIAGADNPTPNTASTGTGGSTPKIPIFLRGDKICIQLGYSYQSADSSSNPLLSLQDQFKKSFDKGNPLVINSDGYTVNLNVEFEGYITKINPRMPLEIWCEDNMWLLKQVQCPNMVFPANTKNTTSIIQDLLKSITPPANKKDPGYEYMIKTVIPTLKTFNVVNGFGTSTTVQTNVGDFNTQNQTIAQVLESWRNDYKLECFFRGNNLYVSPIVYNPTDFISNRQLNSFVYDFQNNIISDDLTYLRKDDLRIGIQAYSVYLTGNTANARTEVTIGDTDGEIRTQYFWPPSDNGTVTQLTEAQLMTQAMLYLNKLKYDGWHGSFVSFGLPCVKHGMAVTLKDNIIPERNGGTYLVKSTKVTFSVDGGFRREIGLHFKLNTDTASIATYQNGL